MEGVLTLEEAKQKGLECHLLEKDIYKYKTNDGYWHIVKDGVDFLKDKQATHCYLHSREICKYMTKTRKWYEVILDI
jgi:hypothetical protein